MKAGLESLVRTYPTVLKSARGMGFMLGIEVQDRTQIPAFKASDQVASLQMVNRLHAAGMLTVPSGNQIVRFLPALNLGRAQVEEGLDLLERVVKSLA